MRTAPIGNVDRVTTPHFFYSLALVCFFLYRTPLSLSLSPFLLADTDFSSRGFSSTMEEQLRPGTMLIFVIKVS